MLDTYRAWRINEAIASYYDGTISAADAFIIIAYVINFWR